MGRLSKQSWFPAAAQLLVDAGPAALTIDRLCEGVRVTKGSFYHHFGSLHAFKTEFLQYLHHRGASKTIEELSTLASPQAKLAALIEAIASESLALDRAVRRWAASDPLVAQLVGDVDDERRSFVERMYRDLFPHNPDRASDLARLAQAFYLGAVMSEPPITGDEYRRLAAILSTATGTRESSPLSASSNGGRS